jgi:hypothetical protein
MRVRVDGKYLNWEVLFYFILFFLFVCSFIHLIVTTYTSLLSSINFFVFLRDTFRSVLFLFLVPEDYSSNKGVRMSILRLVLSLIRWSDQFWPFLLNRITKIRNDQLGRKTNREIASIYQRKIHRLPSRVGNKSFHLINFSFSYELLSIRNKMKSAFCLALENAQYCSVDRVI